MKRKVIGEKWKSFIMTGVCDTETFFSSQQTLGESCEVSAREKWPM